MNPTSSRIFTMAAALAAALLIPACDRLKSAQTAADAAVVDPTGELPARFKTQEPVTKPDFTATGMTAEYRKAIRDAAALLGAQPKPLTSPVEGEQIVGGVSFAVPHEKAEAILFQAHTNFLARGFYLFRSDDNFGFGDQPDSFALLPTTDKYAVMAVMDTNGDNYEIGTAGVIAWMKELEAEHPYVLTDIGFDYMAGRFTAPIDNADDLAKRMYQFCPDIVDQGVDTVEKLAEELKKGTLYLWWD